LAGFDFYKGIIALIPMVLSLTVHEWAHAWSAKKLGDDTAERLGRLTFNPIAHIDLFGTIILPLLLASQGLPGFGWAKPVPVDPTRFRREVGMGKGMAITAGAGPLANVVLAVAATVGLALVIRFDVALPEGAVALLKTVLGMNVSLAVFNLIPVPPLDGSRIVAWLVPYRFRDLWHTVERFSPLLLVALFIYGGALISGPARLVFAVLQHLFNALT
jgi:Zn-dependent protease